MNICIDTRTLSYGVPTSGVYLYAKHVIERMIEKHPEHTFTLLHIGRKNRSFEEYTKKSNVRTVWTPIPNNLLHGINRFIPYPYFDSFIKGDIFFSPHIHALSLKRPERHALTIYDLSFEHYKNFFSHRYNSWHALQHVGAHAKKAGNILTISEFSKYDIANTYGIREERIIVAEPGIDSIFSEKNLEEKEKFKKENGIEKPYILFTGRLEPRKNIEGAIQAFNIVKQNSWAHDFEFKIVGSHGWLCDTIFREAEKSPYRKDIQFLGSVSNETLSHLYNSASCFLYPSFFEGFGIPPLEAQACGTPVITSNRSSFPESIGSSGIMADPWRTEEIAYGLEAILRNDIFADELRKRGRENVKRFLWNESAEKIFSTLVTLHGKSEISNKKH